MTEQDQGTTDPAVEDRPSVSNSGGDDAAPNVGSGEGPDTEAETVGDGSEGNATGSSS